MEVVKYIIYCIYKKNQRISRNVEVYKIFWKENFYDFFTTFKYILCGVEIHLSISKEMLLEKFTQHCSFLPSLMNKLLLISL